MATLKIENLHAEVDGKEILKGINLEIKNNETHAIMGPNGTGKSTLSLIIMGHPKYHVTKGSITLDGEDVLNMSVDERSRKGLFLAMQNPMEVAGVTNSEFIKEAMQSRLGKNEHIKLFKFIKELDKATTDLKMREDLPHRYLNEGFSGGEKKRNEILQMKMLKPSIAILDEIDSGLDVDALRIVAENVNEMRKNTNLGLMLITHYRRLLDLIEPDIVDVMIDGKIVKTGDRSLLYMIDEKGYDFIKAELGLSLDNDLMNKKVVLGNCNVKNSIKKD